MERTHWTPDAKYDIYVDGPGWVKAVYLGFANGMHTFRSVVGKYLVSYSPAQAAFAKVCEPGKGNGLGYITGDLYGLRYSTQKRYKRAEREESAKLAYNSTIVEEPEGEGELKAAHPEKGGQLSLEFGGMAS